MLRSLSDWLLMLKFCVSTAAQYGCICVVSYWSASRGSQPHISIPIRWSQIRIPCRRIITGYMDDGWIEMPYILILICVFRTCLWWTLCWPQSLETRSRNSLMRSRLELVPRLWLPRHCKTLGRYDLGTRNRWGTLSDVRVCIGHLQRKRLRSCQPEDVDREWLVAHWLWCRCYHSLHWTQEHRHIREDEGADCWGVCCTTECSSRPLHWHCWDRGDELAIEFDNLTNKCLICIFIRLNPWLTWLLSKSSLL